MTEHFDICILGAGPAGSAAALMLKKHSPETNILLIESSNFEQWRVGETLSPDAGSAFRELGIWESFLSKHHLSSYGTCAAWETEAITENEFIYHPEGRGWHLNRVLFDEWMAEQAAERGVDLRRNTRYISHTRNEQSILISLSHQSEPYSISAGHVIDASGRRSAFGRNEKVERITHDRLSGAIGFFKNYAPLSETPTYTLVESQKDGWWYSAYLNDGCFIVAFMTDADLLKKKQLQDLPCFLNQLDSSKHTKERFTARIPDEPVRVLSAATIQSQQVYGEDWIALGDAASTFDPLSSQGIYKSIRSGLFGAYAILDKQKGKSGSFAKYQRFVNEEFTEYLQTKKDFYGKVNRWPEADFWKRRQ